ncbi:MAG: ABC transporter permease [Paludibaculum sp.]
MDSTLRLATTSTFETMLGTANLQGDLRYAVRSMRAAPGFTATALITLILGIGATTAIFSVVYAVLLRPLPYREPERLLNIVADEPSDKRSGVDLRLFDALQAQARSLERVAVYFRNTGWSRVIVGGRDNPEQVQAGFASAGFFPLLGMAPLLGRSFDEEEVQRAETVTVISHGLWWKRFSGSAGVLGKSIVVDDKPFTIIGVMPREFRFPATETQLWLPISTNRYWSQRPSPDNVHARGYFMRWNLIARLLPQATPAMAQSELLDLDRRLSQQDRNWNMGLSVRALPMSFDVGDRARLSLWLLFGAVALVLLTACANVANLLLARGASRNKEMAIRLALGASQIRIVQQILTECLVMVSLAGTLALVLASAMIRLLVSWGPSDPPRLEEAALDLPVLAFALVAAVLTAALFGLGPALYAANSDPQNGLRGGGGRNTTARDAKASGLLVIAEFAIAIVLAGSAGLLLQSLWHAESIDLGYRPDRVLTLRLQFLSTLSDSQREASFDRVLERLQAMPGVTGVGGISSLFELGAPPTNSLRSIEGEPAESNRSRPLTWTTVSGDYFQAMGIPLLAGRQFLDRDREGSELVAVIDQSMAQRYWAGRDPIGKRFKGQDRRGVNDDWITVIGVVANARRQGVEREPTPHVFLWHRQSEVTPDCVIRSSVRPEALIASVRQVVRDIDSRTIITNIAPMEAVLASHMIQRRFQTWLIALFAALALTLAVLGIFGVMSHAAARRTHEIGVRMALGANRWDVIRLILFRGLRLAAVGLVIGLGCSAGAARLLSSLLFGVQPMDPASFSLAAALLLTAAGLATFIPAWRASGSDPLLSLRKD